MSEPTNPLFNNERDFLERQKEEYKNALMGDVSQIKEQGQEIGKKAAIAGGVLLAGWLVKRMFSGGKKKVRAEKSKKKHKKGDSATSAAVPAAQPVYASTPLINYEAVLQEQQQASTTMTAEPPHAADVKKKHESFLNSSAGKALQKQVTAMVLLYAAKKLGEYLSSVSENDDIAATPAVAPAEAETTVYTVPEKDAI